MSALNMMRLDPDMQRASDWGNRAGVLKLGADDGYLWHALLKAGFGGLAPKPFRLIERGRPSYLLGYTRATEAELHRHATEFADPAVAAALGLPTMAVKAMPNALAAGRKVGFEVRVRPVVRQTRAGDRTRKREIDVFLQQSRAHPGEELSRASVYVQWLATQFAAGGALLDCSRTRMVWYRRTAICRRDDKRNLYLHDPNGGWPRRLLRR